MYYNYKHTFNLVLLAMCDAIYGQLWEMAYVLRNTITQKNEHLFAKGLPCIAGVAHYVNLH